ncbi:MAG: efflux RND transporter periplasmic adaptor subunit [Bdellovibrio sp.]|nr:efflux RND transporter periplasmic adaptor subunit [Bdellovibrio sp.]
MKKPPSRKKLWIILILLLIVVVAVSVFTYQKKNSLEISYREVRVTRENVAVTILATGTVQPENRLEIKPPIAGRIEKVLVEEGKKVRKGQILAWMSSTERAALLDAARALGAEELKKWEDNYKPTPIFAPINGTIILRNVESGQTFTNVDSVFVMSDRLTVKAQVDETDIAQVRLKQQATIALDAYPENNIKAYVDQIAFDAKTVNNVTTYIVDVLPQDTPDFMRSGMTANVTFLVTAKENILTVPSEALRVRDSKYVVMVKDIKGKKPREIPVQVGITDGKRTEIIEGLVEGETILVAEIKAPTDGPPQNRNPFSPARYRRNTR